MIIKMNSLFCFFNETSQNLQVNWVYINPCSQAISSTSSSCNVVGVAEPSFLTTRNLLWNIGSFRRSTVGKSRCREYIAIKQHARLAEHTVLSFSCLSIYRGVALSSFAWICVWTAAFLINLESNWLLNVFVNVSVYLSDHPLYRACPVPS